MVSLLGGWLAIGGNCRLMAWPTSTDGWNKRLLVEFVRISEYLQLLYHLVFVKEALEPGYPRDSIDKALVGNIYYQLRLGRDHEVGSEAMDELLFVHRPFVFACHKVGRSVRSAGYFLVTI
jgi:hypothetical protein